jgi:hypothetical protein
MLLARLQAVPPTNLAYETERRDQRPHGFEQQEAPLPLAPGVERERRRR